MRRFAGIVLVPLLLAACERGEVQPDVPPRVAEARRVATLDACLAQVLSERSRESLEALQEFQGEDSPMIGPAQAAVAFARAYLQTAELHAAALARADSAMNHARSPADSTRYIQSGEAFLPRPPEPGTLESNVAAAWMRDFAALRADEDHRCHWDT